MAKEDFCFTFFDGDATRDASHMNRTERGGYYDLIIAQRRFGPLSLDQIKKVLGSDFEQIWPALELTMKQEDGKYFIEWLRNSIQQMREHAAHQSNNGKKGGRPPKNKPDQKPNETQLKPNDNPEQSQKKPLEDGNGIGNGLVDEVKEGGAGETHDAGLVPDMIAQFKTVFPKYLFRRAVDFSEVRQIADQIAEWEALVGDSALPENSLKVKLRWGEIVAHIRSDNHFSKYSLSQINKHLPSIIQSFTNQKNGTSTHRNTPPKAGKSAGANELLDSLRADINARGESGFSG